MMKRILASLLVLTGLSVAAFAADDYAPVSVGVGISLPQIYNLKTASDDIDKEMYHAWGINLSGRTMLSQTGFGIFGDGNFYFPYSYEIERDGHSTTYKMDDGNFWGFEILAGVYTCIFNNGRLVIPVGVGPHFNYTKYKIDDDNLSQSSWAFGLGAFANAELALTEKVTVYGGLRLDWDFYQRMTYKYTVDSATTESTDSSSVSNLFVIPAFGIIFRF